jgi:general secretion pathway protein C
VRAIVVVRGEDQEASMAALDVGGKRVVRRSGGDVAGMHLAWVGRDRVWMETGSGICQAKVFGAATPPVIQPAVADAGGAGALERSLKIVKLSPTEIQIDRGSVDRLLEAQTELMKARLVQEKEGDRVVGMRIFGIKPGSALDMLAIQNGDRLESINGAEMTSPEKMLELYARLKTGTVDRFTIHVVRQGKPTNIDYTIR